MSTTVSAKDFNQISVIGKGSYGKVLLVQKKDTKKYYALKILKKEEIIRRNQYEHTMAERRILVSTMFANHLAGKREGPLHCEDGLRLLVREQAILLPGVLPRR